jgi:hypothetical protein
VAALNSMERQTHYFDAIGDGISGLLGGGAGHGGRTLRLQRNLAESVRGPFGVVPGQSVIGEFR